MRWAHGKNRSLWCSWLTRSESRSFYFAGDSGYFHGFAEFGRRFGPLDLALLPIGTYEPRWFLQYQHMSPQDAYRAFLDLRANHLVPMHWGTFQMAWDRTDEAPAVLKRHVEEKKGDLSRIHPLAIGETWPLS